MNYAISAFIFCFSMAYCNIFPLTGKIHINYGAVIVLSLMSILLLYFIQVGTRVLSVINKNINVDRRLLNE